MKMGSRKGNVKIRRKIRRPQIIEKIGSSGWIRTSNPPVNSLMQVVYLVGSSMVYVSLGSRFSSVFGSKLFTDCSLHGLTEDEHIRTPVPISSAIAGRARTARVPPLRA